MPIDYDPNGSSSNVGHGWSGYTWTDPGDVEFTTSKTERLDAKYFASPLTDNVLGLWQAAVAGEQYRQLFSCDSSLVVGDPVYLSGSLEVSLADATSTAKANVIGYCVWKPTTTTCYVVKYYNKSMLSGLTVNQPVYLTDAGSFSASPGTVEKVVGVATGVTTALLFDNAYFGSSGYSGSSSFSGRSGWSGWSSFSGPSGQSGQSGWSGWSGMTLDSGYSGVSAWSGMSGWSGTYSGASGISGTSGWSGASGSSGLSGQSGWSGQSAWSGSSGLEGPQGQSGYSGFSGRSGHSGISGFFGRSGASGWSGMNGTVAYSGTSGWSGQGRSGWSGISAWSGNSGRSGYSGVSGSSAWSGMSATSGMSGYSAVALAPYNPNLIDNGNFQVAQRMGCWASADGSYLSLPSTASMYSGFSSSVDLGARTSEKCMVDRWFCLGFSSVYYGAETIFDTPIVEGSRILKIGGGSGPNSLVQIIDSEQSSTVRGKPLFLRFFCNDCNRGGFEATIHCAVFWNRNRLKSSIVNDWSSTTYTAGNFFTSDAGFRLVKHSSWTNPSGQYVTMSMDASEVGYYYDGLDFLTVMFWYDNFSTGLVNEGFTIGAVDLSIGDNERSFRSKEPAIEHGQARRQLQLFQPRADYNGSSWSGASGYNTIAVGNWDATSGTFHGTVKFDEKMRDNPDFSYNVLLDAYGPHQWLEVPTTWSSATFAVWDGTSEWSAWSAAVSSVTPDGAIITCHTEDVAAFRPGTLVCRANGTLVPGNTAKGMAEFSAEL